MGNVIEPKSRKEYRDLGFKTKSKFFKQYYNSGLLKKVDTEYVQEVKKFWLDNYGDDIDPSLHVAYYNLTNGKKEVKLAPPKQMWNEILPFFNDMNIRIGYSDKNLYDKLVPSNNKPKTILKCIRGNMYTADNEAISTQVANEILHDIQEDLIIKASDGDNGKGVSKATFNGTYLEINQKKIDVKDLIRLFNNNFIIQDVIKQHPIMAQPHPSSVNTIRMVTFRWNNKIQHVVSMVRFGGSNKVIDHTGAGGIALGVDKDGNVQKFGFDKDNNKLTKHPTTNFDFSQGIKIPGYDKAINLVENLHKEILHHDLVSWDIAIDPNEEPVFIECNFRGTTARYQLLSETPMFGDLTEEVLQYLKENKKSLDRDVKLQIPIKLKRRIRKYKKSIEELNKELEELKSK